MGKKPNVVVFIADHFRADALGHLGSPASHTPNLDKLARTEAVSFRNAFCQNPVCTPSRCSLMSGRYTHVRGHRTMQYVLEEDEPCFLRNVKRAGWHVFWGGKNDFANTTRTDWVNDYADEYDLVLRGDPNAVRDKVAAGLKPPGDAETNPHYYSFYRGVLPQVTSTKTETRFGTVFPQPTTGTSGRRAPILRVGIPATSLFVCILRPFRRIPHTPSSRNGSI